jgi:hypothetical protein
VCFKVVCLVQVHMESSQDRVCALEFETAVIVSQESSGLAAGHGALVALTESHATLEFEGEFLS